MIKFINDMIKVLRNALQNAGSLVKASKYLKPTHETPYGPMPGRYLRKAKTFPNIGIYLNIIK